MSIVVAYITPEVAYLASDGLLLATTDGKTVRRDGSKLIQGDISACGWIGMNSSKDDTTGEVTYAIEDVLKEAEEGGASFLDVAQKFPSAIRAGLQRVIDKHVDDQVFHAHVEGKRVGIDVVLVGCQDGRIMGVRGWHDVELGHDSKPTLKLGPEQYGYITHDLNNLTERPTIMGLNTEEQEQLWQTFKAQCPNYQAYFSPLQRLQKLVECAIELYPDKIGWPINTLAITCGSCIAGVIRNSLASR